MGNGQNDEGDKRRSTSPLLVDEKMVELQVEQDVKTVMKSFCDCSEDLKKRIEAVLRVQISGTVRNKLERDVLLQSQTKIKKEVDELERKYHKLLAIGIARGQVEDIEEQMTNNFEFPSKADMITQLKEDGRWEFKGARVSYHYVQFYYYVVKSQTGLATYIRECIGKDVSLHDFCCLVAKLYSKTSARIHEPEETLTLGEMKSGLQLYGITQPKLLECVDIIDLIYRQRLPKKGDDPNFSAGASQSSKSHSQASNFNSPTRKRCNSTPMNQSNKFGPESVSLARQTSDYQDDRIHRNRRFNVPIWNDNYSEMNVSAYHQLRHNAGNFYPYLNLHAPYVDDHRLVAMHRNQPYHRNESNRSRGNRGRAMHRNHPYCNESNRSRGNRRDLH